MGQQRAYLAAVGGDNHRFAPTEAIPGSNVSGAATLLQEFLDHAQRDPKTAGHLGPGALRVVIGGKDSFTQIQREGSHAQSLPHPPNNGYNFN